MNNMKHVGSLAICSESRNMPLCFIVYLALFQPKSEKITENIM